MRADQTSVSSGLKSRLDILRTHIQEVSTVVGRQGERVVPLDLEALTESDISERAKAHYKMHLLYLQYMEVDSIARMLAATGKS